MTLQTWFLRWGISPEAQQDFMDMVTDGYQMKQTSGDSETAVSNNYRAHFAESGQGILWRNNLGAAFDPNGNFIRYGLANDSKQMNKIVKSGDLIGIRKVFITENMVGTTIGQFVSRETKKVGWQYTGDEREEAQANWIALVNKYGGDAQFVGGIK